MSKSLYQYKFNPEDREKIDSFIRQILPGLGYKPSRMPNVFEYGSGWFAAKRRIEYKMSQDVLSICIWKVSCIFLPMIEVGCVDANSFMGMALNGGMKHTVEDTVALIARHCQLIPITICEKVDDNFFEGIRK